MKYRYYVLLCDELGGEFGVYVNAADMDSCMEIVAAQYPESGVIDARKV